MNDTGKFVNECQRQRAAGKSNNDLVTFLRTQGCSKVESMAIVARAFGVGLGEAKEIVHLSTAWADMRERDERFQRSLETGLGDANGKAKPKGSRASNQNMRPSRS